MRLHANPSDWIEKRPFENGLFSGSPCWVSAEETIDDCFLKRCHPKCERAEPSRRRRSHATHDGDRREPATVCVANDRWRDARRVSQKKKSKSFDLDFWSGLRAYSLRRSPAMQAGASPLRSAMPSRRGAICARALASELADVLRLIIEPFGFVEPVSGSGKEKNHPRGMVFSFSALIVQKCNS